MSYIYPQQPAQQGWQCPVCGTVNAPWMPTCGRCPTYTQVTLSDSGGPNVAPLFTTVSTSPDNALSDDSGPSITPLFTTVTDALDNVADKD